MGVLPKIEVLFFYGVERQNEELMPCYTVCCQAYMMLTAFIVTFHLQVY